MSCHTGLRFQIPKGLTLQMHEFVELMEELIRYVRYRGPAAKRWDRVKRRCCGRCLRGAEKYPQEWLCCCRCCPCYLSAQSALDSYVVTCRVYWLVLAYVQ